MKPWFRHPVFTNTLRLTITVVLIWLVSKRVNLPQIGNLLRTAAPGWLALAVVTYVSSFVLSSQRSAVYLASVGIRLRAWTSFGLYLQGTVYNVLLPGGVGGDGYKILWLRREGGPSVRQIFQAFFFERLSGLWAIMALLTALNGLLKDVLLPPGLMWTTLALGTVAYYLVLRRFFPVFTGAFVRTHLISVIVQLQVSLAVICILQTQPLPVSIPSYLFSFHGSTVFSILNIGLSGLGVREFAMGYAARMLGTDPVISVFVASAFWIVSTAATLPGLWFVFVARGSKRNDGQG